VLVASSRGGTYAADLIQSGSWAGPTLLLSAMSTAQCCKEGLALLVAHGTRDGTNPIHRVRQDVELATPGLVLLREFDDDHSLHSIVESDKLKELVQEAYELGSRVKEVMVSQKEAPRTCKPPADTRVSLLAQITARHKD